MTYGKCLIKYLNSVPTWSTRKLLANAPCVQINYLGKF